MGPERNAGGIVNQLRWALGAGRLTRLLVVSVDCQADHFAMGKPHWLGRLAMPVLAL